MCGGGSSKQATVNNQNNVQPFSGYSDLPANHNGIFGPGAGQYQMAVAQRNNEINQHQNGSGPVLPQLQARYATPNQPVIPTAGTPLAVTGNAPAAGGAPATGGSGSTGAVPGGGSIAGALGGMFGGSIYPSIQPAMGAAGSSRVIR